MGVACAISVLSRSGRYNGPASWALSVTWRC